MSAPTWEDIIERTEEDLRAEQFLEACGLRLEAKRAGKERYQATIHRGRKARGSFSLTVAADSGPPSAYAVVVAIALRAALSSAFSQRSRAFFTEEEQTGLERVL